MKIRIGSLGILISCIIISGCFSVDIKISSNRNPTPKSLIVDEKLRITTWGAIQINESHFFPSSFQIRYDDTYIYIDPVGLSNADSADYIFLTHTHPDHLSIATLEHITKTNTKIICPKLVAKKLGDSYKNVRVVEPGDFMHWGDLSFEVIAAYNLKRVFLWMKAHRRAQNLVGYIMKIDNVSSIYHTGDTDYIPELQSIENIDVALLAVGGDNLTMDIQDAVTMVNRLKPQIFIPMHYELKNRMKIDTLLHLIDTAVAIHFLD